jgi:hypothetical protein
MVFFEKIDSDKYAPIVYSLKTASHEAHLFPSKKERTESTNRVQSGQSRPNVHSDRRWSPQFMFCRLPCSTFGLSVFDPKQNLQNLFDETNVSAIMRRNVCLIKGRFKSPIDEYLRLLGYLLEKARLQQS